MLLSMFGNLSVYSEFASDSKVVNPSVTNDRLKWDFENLIGLGVELLQSNVKIKVLSGNFYREVGDHNLLLQT